MQNETQDYKSKLQEYAKNMGAPLAAVEGEARTAYALDELKKKFEAFKNFSRRCSDANNNNKDLEIEELVEKLQIFFDALSWSAPERTREELEEAAAYYGVALSPEKKKE